MGKHSYKDTDEIINKKRKSKKNNNIKNNKESNKKERKLLKKFIILLIIILILLGIWLGISIHNWKTIAKEMIKNQNSTVLDSDGNIIAKLGSEKINENIYEIPNNLKNAYISIEDERFYKHHGIDTKRTVAAIGSYIIHLGSSSFGGSTITQQLVKNITGNDSNSITRKVDEWIKAFSLESCVSKDEILKSYLNIIYVGPNIYGVEKGALYYFNKSASELDLAECAYLAGLTHSPNSYNPFTETDRSEKISKRTKTVLNQMLDLKYVSQEDYNNAITEVNEGLKFSKGDVQAQSNGIYSYHTDALVSELVSSISKKKHISETFATNYLNMANLKIYSTQNSNIQNNMEKDFSNNKYILKSSKNEEETSQAAMIIINQYNGQVLGCVGGLGEKKSSRGFNRATQAIRQTGSASKPLAVLAPALKKKTITASTIYDDSASEFSNIDGSIYSPTDYNHYLGNVTVRRAVESSQNIPFVRMMDQITPKESIKFLKSLGITTLTEKDNNLSLALGGLDKGISPLEMAGAYATIANNGVYIEPTFYTKVEDSNRKIILKCKQKSRRVFSEDIAYILKDLLRQPVIGSSGTATYCRISGMDVAAKTGTTNDDYDRWLCGFTNYYTGVTWYGYDISEEINYNGKNPAAIIWADVMRNIHKSLSNSTFTATKGVRSANICAKTGKTATSGCPDTYTEYFLKGTIPSQCNEHSGSNKSNTNSNKKDNSKQNNSKPKNEIPDNQNNDLTTDKANNSTDNKINNSDVNNTSNNKDKKNNTNKSNTTKNENKTSENNNLKNSTTSTNTTSTNKNNSKKDSKQNKNTTN